MKNDDKTINQLLEKINRLNTKISFRDKDISVYKQEIVKIQDENKITNIALDKQLETFFLFDPITSKSVKWNKSFTKISGYTDDEIAKLPAPASYYSPEDLEQAGKFIQKIVKNNSGTIELELICKDGQKIPFEYQVVAINDESGETKYLLSIGRNIIERKQAEESIREKTEAINAIVETSKEWIWAMNLQGIHTYSNPAIEQILGYPVKKLVGNSSFHLMHEDDRKMVETKLLLWISNKQGWESLVIRWMHKDGSWRYLESSGVPIINDDGEVTGFRGVDRDITAHKEILEKLTKSEEKFRSVIDNIELIGLMLDENANIIYANDFLLHTTGYERKEIIDKNWFDIFIEIESTKEDVLNVFRKTAKEGNLATNYENPILTKTGKQKIIKWNNTSFTTTEGQIIITSIGEDITERKKIEMELLQNKILLESSIESPQDMIILSLDHEYKYLYYNEVHKISMMTAYNTKPTIGHCIFDFITNKTDIKRLKTHYDEALSGDGHTFIDKYGEEPNCFYYEVRIYPIYNDKKEIIGITSFSQDITKRKQAEAELKAKHDSLMMSNDLFVGREIKMIELKKEINELLEGKGEKPKYKIIR